MFLPLTFLSKFPAFCMFWGNLSLLLWITIFPNIANDFISDSFGLSFYLRFSSSSFPITRFGSLVVSEDTFH